MSKLNFNIGISAPKEKVWEAMLADETYREWTSVFNPGGSYYEGSWDKGSKIVFLGPDEKGNLGGMVSKIVENKPYEYISIEHLGEVVDGVEDTTSENAKQWAGSHENYSFNEVNGVTTVTVEMESDNEDKEMLEILAGMWPTALQKLKEIAEK